MSGIITLTTDFGLQDHYVSAMKAVMLGIAPTARFVDISHEIPAHDIMAGAWVLYNSAMLYPPGTVHLVVVDPGVGTERSPVAVQIEDQFFVGPDNGIFSLLAKDHDCRVVKLTNKTFWHRLSSSTFHGREIFAPVAAHLSRGVQLDKLGDKVDDLVTYRWAMPISDKDGLQGWIIHIDRFGNLVSNISAEMIREVIDDKSVKIYVGNTILDEIEDTFGSVEEGEPVAYIGSSNMLEIAINQGDAATMLSVQKGASISLVLQK